MGSRTLSAVACVFLGALFVSCSSFAPVGGPITETDWKAIRGPKNNPSESADWYLNAIMSEMGKQGSGATTDQKATIGARVWERSRLIHEYIPRDASWARVHRAYRQALDKNWKGVIHSLREKSGPPSDPANPNDVFTTPKNWPDYKPVVVDGSLSIGTIFAQIQTNTAPNSSEYSDAQYAKIVSTYENCVPGSSASAASAWVGFWEALEISRHPPSNINGGTVDEPRAAAIICEVCPN